VFIVFAKIMLKICLGTEFAERTALREHQKKDDPMIIAVWQRFPQTIF
jgi:hypothetical protein